MASTLDLSQSVVLVKQNKQACGAVCCRCIYFHEESFLGSLEGPRELLIFWSKSQKTAVKPDT